MELTHLDAYAARGLDQRAIGRLGRFGDLLLDAGFNVTSIREPVAIERFHFLDCLALVDVPGFRAAKQIADLGSGGGLPALVLAIVLPETRVVAVESQQKKCSFIEQAAAAMDLPNVEVKCTRAEDYGRAEGRGAHDIVVSRALAALPAIAEYSLPLLALGGLMVAMKGEISTEERIQAQKALDILGGNGLESVKLEPFTGAENRWVHMCRKVGQTPASFPRRPGIVTRRPLGEAKGPERTSR